MERFLSFPIDNTKIKKAVVLALILFLALPVLLNTLALVPLYATLAADSVYSGSVLTTVIKYVQDFMDLCAFSVSYALIIFSTLLLNAKTTALVVVFYSSVYILQIPLKLLMNVAVYGTLGTAADIFVDVMYLCIYLGLQMVQLLLVYSFARVDSNKFRRYAETSAAKKTAADERKILPLSKFWDWNNPLLRSAIKMSLLVIGLKIVSRIINDISYGAPTSFGEVMIMTVYYISDIVYGIVAYIAATLTISVFYDVVKVKEKRSSGE